MAFMDFSAPTGITKTCKLARVRVEPCPVDELIRMRNQLGEEQLRAFKRRYGDILDLLPIPVPVDAIKTISQYWDNSLRCFVLPHCHLALVLEEYAALMRMPVHEKTPVYSYPGRLPSQIQVAELLGLSREQVEFMRQGQVDIVPLKFLIGYLTDLGKKKNWPLFGRVLALSIYGVVLFPAVKGGVDLAAISVFMAVEYQRANPVPAILADTVISLAYCLGKGGGQLRCCLQLLTIWLGNHVFGKEWSRGVRWDQTHHPLRDFNEREGKTMKEGQALATPKDWVSFFKGLPGQNIKWKLAWWDDEEVLLSCGDFPNVPLVSARGGINYNPSVALKQLAYEQKMPSQETLQPFFFFHDDQTMGWNDRIARAWKHMCFKGRVELGIRMVYATPEFEVWIHGQEGEGRPPVFPSPNPLMGKKDEKMKEALDAKITQQKEEIEYLMAERARQRREVKKGEEEYVQLHRDLRGLKRRGEPARVSREDELEQEVVKLQAEMAACKAREHEMKKKWEAEREKSGELQSKLKAEEKRAREAHEEKKELALHLEQERGASDILHEEIEEMASTHIKRVEELVWSRAEFQRESHEMRNRHEQIGRWINGAVPTFSDTFYRAEDSMRPFYTSPELQNFLGLSRRLIEVWDELRRSPI